MNSDWSQSGTLAHLRKYVGDDRLQVGWNSFKGDTLLIIQLGEDHYTMHSYMMDTYTKSSLKMERYSES